MHYSLTCPASCGMFFYQTNWNAARYHNQPVNLLITWSNYICISHLLYENLIS